MLWIAAAAAWAVVPDPGGVGPLRWGQPPPDGPDPCVEGFAAVEPLELFGVTPTGMTAGFNRGELEAVVARFEGLAAGDAAEAAVTSALGEPYEPYRDDLYWPGAHMVRDPGGSAMLAIVDPVRVGQYFLGTAEPEWWMVTLDEVRFRVGQGPEPARPEPREFLHCGDPPNTTARSFDDPSAPDVPAPAPRPATISVEALRVARETQARGACAFPPFGCRQALADLAEFYEAHPEVAQPPDLICARVGKRPGCMERAVRRDAP